MKTTFYDWAVIGAGPAGIAAVGRLIDSGVVASDIIWLDPHFKVGDLGQYWRHVSSNTTVGRFLDFLRASPAFAYDKASPKFRLNHLPLDQTCVLNDVVEPLQWVTDALRMQICCVNATVTKLSLTNRRWHLNTAQGVFQASKVLVATGAEPIALNHLVHDAVKHSPPTMIPLETAIDGQKLAQVINKNDSYAVFGSSHSAIIVVRLLVELGVKKVMNFYRSPCRYAIDQGSWILFDNTGLKGDTATWARDNIDGVLPANLVRYVSNDTNIARYLPECQHVIDAVGFAPRRDLEIEGCSHWTYDRHHGIIAPGLFGLGIGFPELASDPMGFVESQVGLWKFMVYLNNVLPLWLRYPG